MRATFTSYDPRADGSCLTGSVIAGVEELDINGKSLNRPVLSKSKVFHVRVWDGALYASTQNITSAGSRSVCQNGFRKIALVDRLDQNNGDLIHPRIKNNNCPKAFPEGK